ncbi:hypothetical protein UL82_10020 [Corynebacterium kutscheri]|uniref:Peptidoglycan recognition protein family domain-containing protein n=1 Tax=Corynebacterium kutscheri TaxID=35755 RepID=A0A0F6TE08_9CORY|nr:N-acetylmuramoyl-L-alanine amidase [Corynebacterium kutscheri]AKE42141.1 hypothetical protein UL82_10020 [Corynebacterium kutscheri]VEH10484.1 Peptidoglycan recognition protein [Corynebacterium kutscheri]
MQQRRRLTPTVRKSSIATVLAVSLIASAAVGIGTYRINYTQGDSIAPIDASIQTTSFADGENVLVNDPAIVSQGEGTGPRTVKQFTRDEEFSQFAITWKGEKDVAVFIRGLKEDGSWTDWYDADPLDYGSDDPNATRGTDLIYVEPTKTVQVSINGVDVLGNTGQDVQLNTDTGTATDNVGAQPPAEVPVVPQEVSADQVENNPPAEVATPHVDLTQPAPPTTQQNSGVAPLPSNFGDIRPVAEEESLSNSAADFDAVFIEGGESTLPENGIELAADSDGIPRVISRAGWGANENIRCSSPQYDDKVTGIAIHHTAGSNNYTEAQAPGIVRGIYQYHAQTLGWCDVGYHSLADKYGNLYEGRYGGLNRNVIGAHAGGFNRNTWAIAMLGNYETEHPSSAIINSVGNLAGWRSKVAGMDPSATNTHYSEGGSYTSYPQGTPVLLPNIFGHKDVGNTACPGQHAYAQLGNIRNIAKTKYNSIAGSAPGGGNLNLDNQGNGQTNPGATSSTQSAIKLLTTLLGGNGSSNGNTTTTITGVVSLVALALGIASKQGLLPGTVSKIGDVEIVDGLTISALTPYIKPLLTLISSPELAKVANSLSSVLGAGGTNAAAYTAANGEEITYTIFDNGIALHSPSTGAHALWGVIADTWAAQGFDAGPLGLPINEEYTTNDELIRVDFQGGYITFDPATGAVDIRTTS